MEKEIKKKLNKLRENALHRIVDTRMQLTQRTWGKYGVCAKCNEFEDFNCVNVSDGCINYYELGFQKSIKTVQQIENVQQI